MTQIQLSFDAPCRVPPEGTDNYRVLRALVDRKLRLNITNSFALCGVHAIGQRISNLRLQFGWDVAIKVEMVPTPGKRSMMAEYSIRPGYSWPQEKRAA